MKDYYTFINKNREEYIETILIIMRKEDSIKLNIVVESSYIGSKDNYITGMRYSEVDDIVKVFYTNIVENWNYLDAFDTIWIKKIYDYLKLNYKDEFDAIKNGKDVGLL